MSGQMHEDLFRHLYPGDGLEAIAVAICGRASFRDQAKLLIHEIIKIPYDECNRAEGLLTWPTHRISSYFELVMNRNMAILKIHSHPGGYNQFSETDDASDSEFFESVYGWSESEDPHASAVMLPDGKIFGRAVLRTGEFQDLEKILVVGDEIRIWANNLIADNHDESSLRTRQAFGVGTVNLLKSLSIGIVGCSGTGSPLIEQLVRLGVGRLVLVDPDIVEEKNLNRIIHSTRQDAISKKYKVEVLKAAADGIGLGTSVEAFPKNIFDDINILKTLSACDVLFGCVDSIDGRHLLNQIASFYLIPFFDLGVRLSADGKGGIDQIHGTVHYLQPSRGSLLSRRVYTNEGLRASGMLRNNPMEYQELKRSGYIVNVDVQSPAVISVNTLVSSLAVNELLARIHNFRNEENSDFEINRFSLTDGYFYHEKDETIDIYLKKFCGRGDMKPFLNMPELSNK